MNYRRILPTAALIIGTLVLSAGVQTFAAAWTAPAGPPPSANAEAPLNTGIQTQTKSGALVLGAGLGMGTTSLLVRAGNVVVNGDIKTQGLLFNFGDLGPTPIATTRYVNLDEDTYTAGSGYPECNGDTSANRYVCGVTETRKCTDQYYTGSTCAVMGGRACVRFTPVYGYTNIACRAIAVPTSFPTSVNSDVRTRIASISGTVRHEKRVWLQGASVIRNDGDHVFFPVASSFPVYSISGITSTVGIPTNGLPPPSYYYHVGGLSGGNVSIEEWPSAANGYILKIYFGHGGAGDGNFNIDLMVLQY